MQVICTVTLGGPRQGMPLADEFVDTKQAR